MSKSCKFNDIVVRIIRGTLTSSSLFQTSVLHFKYFEHDFFAENYKKSVFQKTVKIKIVSSLVATGGNIDFDFTEKSQCFIGKFIRNRFSSWPLCGYLLYNAVIHKILM